DFPGTQRESERDCVWVLPAYACESIVQYIQILTHTHMLATPIYKVVVVVVKLAMFMELSVMFSAARRKWGRYRRREHKSCQSMGVNHFRIMLLMVPLNKEAACNCSSYSVF